MTDRPKELGALWIRQTQSGSEKLSMKVDQTLEPGWYTILPNSFKGENERAPDWRIMPNDERPAPEAPPQSGGSGDVIF